MNRREMLKLAGAGIAGAAAYKGIEQFGAWPSLAQTSSRVDAGKLHEAHQSLGKWIYLAPQKLGGGTQVTLFLQNLDPRRDLYVLGPAAGVFIQADRGWREMPSRPTDEGEGRVVRVTGRHRFTLTFTPDVTTFEEQIAGYYHVRITSSMLVSQSREPRDDLFDRTDAYYVYLKPHGADDADVRRRNGWSSTPPVWIPRPPH